MRSFPECIDRVNVTRPLYVPTPATLQVISRAMQASPRRAGAPVWLSTWQSIGPLAVLLI